MKYFLTGFCMGLADLVPGISGGTVAFLSGIYDTLIDAIRKLSFKVLLPILIGMALAIFSFAHLIHLLLNDPTSQRLLFASFFLLMAGAIMACLPRVTRWGPAEIALLLFGTLAAYFLTTTTSSLTWSLPLHLDYFLSGSIAVTAMLLPGISGSYLLILLGKYPSVIAALSHFSTSLLHGHLNTDAAWLLLTLGLGILSGALLFSRAIRFALTHYHSQTLALLIGLMTGGLPYLL
ncbi:MAG: DUF368 domain-containing protein [Chlamydiia bacterium]|nr:DUF368 domain-containing protein [Chlamydiia bacterium]